MMQISYDVPPPQVEQLPLFSNEKVCDLNGEMIYLVASYKVFKVHKEQLAGCSPIFSDMFLVCHTTQGTDEEIEGVPRVEIQDDPEEFAHLLRYIWDPSYVPDSVEVTFALIRLSTKYMIDEVRDRALRRLHALLPPARTQTAALQYYDANPDGAFEAIEMSLVHDVPDLLETALYWMACNSERVTVSAKPHAFFGYSEAATLLIVGDRIRKFWGEFVSVVQSVFHLENQTARITGCTAKHMNHWRSCSLAFDVALWKPEIAREGAKDPLKLILQDPGQYNLCIACRDFFRAICQYTVKRIFDCICTEFKLTTGTQ